MRFIAFSIFFYVVLASMQWFGVTSIHLYYLAGVVAGMISMAIALSMEIER